MVLATSEYGQEFAGIDFKDERLTNRIVRIGEELGKHSASSIPAATNGRAEMEAVYRFVNNPKVTPEKIAGPHREATLQRMRQCDLVLLVQDTTELELTRPTQQVAGAGPLSHNSRRGSYLHPLLAINADGLALGIPWYEHWTRDEIRTDLTAEQKRKAARETPFEEKESFRWVQGVRAAVEAAKACPQTQCVVIGDSESDIYEVLAESRALSGGGKLEIIVRASGDRNIKIDEGTAKMIAAVRGTPCLSRAKVDVSQRTPKTNVKPKSSRQGAREARGADVEIRACTVVIRSPRNTPARPALSYNVVLVEETSPPEGESAIQWVLITSLPIETLEDVERIISYYCNRWQIEIYFKTLKSGCRIQERYFETMNRLENCLAIYMVIAWKILYLCRLGQTCPDLPCDIVFSVSEWKAVYTIVTKNKPLQSAPPSLNDMIRMIASLGGYVIRNATRPGTQTLWLGLQRVHDFADAWDAFGPECPVPR
jgi:hypothetical protein